MNISLNSVYLLMSCLNLMGARTKEKFESFIRDNKIDLVLNALMQDGTFPKWFMEGSHFDPLYARLLGLRECFSLAVSYGILRMDGTTFHYHLDMSPELITNLLTDLPVSKDEAGQIAEKLEALLNE